MEDLRYPIGEFDWHGKISDEQRTQLIVQIGGTPAQLRVAVAGFSSAQLDTPYRSGGWSVRQVVHHLADSHLNSYIRFKLALTENEPTIKTYDQELWARLADSSVTPVETSLTLLESLHQRWTSLLRSLTPSDFERKFRHPERGVMTLDENLALYAWHGRHHIAHILALRERKGW